MCKVLFLLLFVFACLFGNAQTTIFPANTVWSYLDQNIRPAGWPTSHDASTWLTGAAPLGYSNGVTTTVSYGPNASNKYTTTYFNKVVSIPNASTYKDYTIHLVRDDGAVLYINGVEVVRTNMPTTPAIGHSTFALVPVGGADETAVHTYTIPSSYFVNGNNIFSLELHQSDLTSTDLSFSLEVIANPIANAKTVIGYGDSWKFLDNGSDQGTGWRATAFNDASWNIGNGEFGYGDGGEATLVNYGPDANNKFITTYFRKSINIANPSTFTDFTLNIKRDDGAVVYVNGIERFRTNMPAGTILYNTVAPTFASDDGNTAQTITLSPLFFTAGTNEIAVEIHQNDVASTDLSFNLELIGNLPVITPTTLIPFASTWKYLDDNTRPANWETSGFNDAAWDSGPGLFGYGDESVITTIDYGPDANNKFVTTYFRKAFTVTDPTDLQDFTLHVYRDDGIVVYVNGVEVVRDNMPTGVVTHSTYSSICATDGGDAINTFRIPASAFTAGANIIAVELHQCNATSSDLVFDLELLGYIPLPPPTTVIPFGGIWKYLDNDTRPANWETTGFDDAAWSSGPGLFGYGDGSVVTCVKSSAAPVNCTPGFGGTKYITTYFRKAFTITDPTGLPDFKLNVYRDDGIVVYVNGVEVVRDNMPAGVVTHSTFSTQCATDGGDAINTFSIPASAFVAGTNEIAVEVHQCNVESSDLVFDLELLGYIPLPPPTTIIDYGDDWKYLDNGSDQGIAWQAPAFNDAAWATGPAELGYGDNDEATVVSYGPDANNKYVTTYFRKTFNVTNLNTFINFTLNVVRDDGFVVYLNGIEVARDNLPAGAPLYNTYAVTPIANAGEYTPISFTISPCAFVEGANTIAVEMHQVNATSTDLGFNLKLVANTGVASGGTAVLTRGPYLQVGGETGMTFRWRTDIPTKGKINVGPSVGNYTTATEEETCPTTEHIVRVTGLTADTKYFYEVTDGIGTVLQNDADNFFTTTPPANTTRKIRIAAFGDCGRNDNSYQSDNLANYNNYLATNGIDAADAWILMGDNAYNSGTDAEYTSKFFNVYGSTILKNHKLYPSPGNHDYANSGANKTSRSLPYHNNFSVPQEGEAGGVPSHKQNYYSYNVGNIHFLSLDSYGIEPDGTSIETSGTSALKTWLDADLAANTSKWVVAYWHHPPYTKGSHDSDGEGDLVNIRQNFITFLENRGVDLIICGHSHAYERGYLLKNFTGSWTSFNPATHAVSTSSATYTSNSTCPYVYNTSPADHGTVYVVAGSAGASTGGTNAGFGANAMPFAINDGGIFYFEVEDNRLDAKMLRRNGTIFDQFTIMKDVNQNSSFSINNGTQQNLTASWPQSGNYTWTPAAVGTSRTVSVTPPDNAVTVYSVADDYGCVSDQFTITTSYPVPVTILDFDVKLQNKKANITWSTATESNNKFFTIERSANGIDFTAFATVNGAGNSADVRFYSYVDANPLPGTSFYRLSQTDFDAKVKYVGIRRITNNNINTVEVKTLSGYSGKLVLQINTELQGKYNIRVIDLAGREWINQPINIGRGTTTKEFTLSSGVYIWEVRNDKGEAMLQKVWVQ